MSDRPAPRSSLSNGRPLAPDRPYAECLEETPPFADRAVHHLSAVVLRPLGLWLRDPARRLSAILPAVARHEAGVAALTDAALAARAHSLRPQLRSAGFTLALAGEAFALVREAAQRSLGRRHFDSQLLAGWALLQGRLAEMATGEGKTFAATLPACTVALAGYPVHVVTVNDYLAQRDAEELAPLYRFLGLEVGFVVQGLPPATRRAAYARPITYAANKEVAFDYLRDRIALARGGGTLQLALAGLGTGQASALTLRGLHYAIVDEADSVFIDEARTPLILSAETNAAEAAKLNAQALVLARSLVAEADYRLRPADRTLYLTDAGRRRIEAEMAPLGGTWGTVRGREDLALKALIALHLFERDIHYVVAEGKVQIVDEGTGRLMPDRSWENGLHQLVEAKEGCAPTPRRDTLTRITYQRLFGRYLRLAGMSGTVAEVATEVDLVYGLVTLKIPRNRPSRQRNLGVTLCPDEAAKWRLVAGRVAALVAAGRPVLVGTRSVGASERLSEVLAAAGLEHALLNARQDAAEAEVVAAAGQPARVTVATNMAGRGTDIRLATGVAALGGLHVILTEHHESRRVDRQLFGRCGRQGDPGSYETVVALDDDLLSSQAPRLVALARGLGPAGRGRLMHALLRGLSQWRAERRNAAIRSRNLQLDRQLDRFLAFSGRAE